MAIEDRGREIQCDRHPAKSIEDVSYVGQPRLDGGYRDEGRSRFHEGYLFVPVRIPALQMTERKRRLIDIGESNARRIHL